MDEAHTIADRTEDVDRAASADLDPVGVDLEHDGRVGECGEVLERAGARDVALELPPVVVVAHLDSVTGGDRRRGVQLVGDRSDRLRRGEALFGDGWVDEDLHALLRRRAEGRRQVDVVGDDLAVRARGGEAGIVDVLQADAGTEAERLGLAETDLGQALQRCGTIRGERLPYRVELDRELGSRHDAPQ